MQSNLPEHDGIELNGLKIKRLVIEGFIEGQDLSIDDLNAISSGQDMRVNNQDFTIIKTKLSSEGYPKPMNIYLELEAK